MKLKKIAQTLYLYQLLAIVAGLLFSFFLGDKIMGFFSESCDENGQRHLA